MTDTTKQLTDRRTGQIDALLFGQMIDLLAGAIRKRADFRRDIIYPTTEQREIIAEMSGRILGIAQACNIVSGIPSDTLIERVTVGAVRR